MASEGDSIDYYELLGINEDAQDQEIHRAWRKTSLKYHPDKNPNDPKAAEKFHMLQLAYNALIDVQLRKAYDSERLAKLARNRREEAFNFQRKSMVDDLRERERQFYDSLEKKENERDRLQEKLRALQKESANLRRQRENRLREEQEQSKRRKQETPSSKISELDRSIRIRWKRKYADQVNDAYLRSIYSSFGTLQNVVIQKDISKEKKYVYSIIVFETLSSAYSAINAEKPSKIYDVQWLKPPKSNSNTPTEKDTTVEDYEEITIMRMKQKHKQKQKENERKATSTMNA